jgi:hypothetical protein
MLRFDYTIQSDNMVNVTIVEETEDKHSLCGRIVLSKKGWKDLIDAITFYPEKDDNLNYYFKFENKEMK